MAPRAVHVVAWHAHGRALDWGMQGQRRMLTPIAVSVATASSASLGSARGSSRSRGQTRTMPTRRLALSRSIDARLLLFPNQSINPLASHRIALHRISGGRRPRFGPAASYATDRPPLSQSPALSTTTNTPSHVHTRQTQGGTRRVDECWDDDGGCCCTQPALVDLTAFNCSPSIDTRGLPDHLL